MHSFNIYLLNAIRHWGYSGKQNKVYALKEFAFQRMIQAVNKQIIYNILPDNDKGYEGDT